MKTRKLAQLAIVAMILATGVAQAQTPSTGSGQGFPAKPVRIVVPAVPGGGTDILARLLSPRLTENFGQSVIIENRGGAYTTIGTEHVARSAPDGYTVLIATTPHAINPTLLAR